MKRAIIFVSAAVFVAGTVVGHFKPYPIREIKNVLLPPPPIVEPSPLDNPTYRFRTSILDTFASTAKVVMAGDSITEFAEWSDIFPGMSISNRGISGDRVEGMLARVEQIAAMRPAKAFS